MEFDRLMKLKWAKHGGTGNGDGDSMSLLYLYRTLVPIIHIHILKDWNNIINTGKNFPKTIVAINIRGTDV